MPLFGRLSEYDLFAKAIKDAVDPAMRELADLKEQVSKINDDRATKSDINSLRVEIQSHASTVYSREMVDSKIADVRTEIGHVKEDLDKTAKVVADGPETDAHTTERRWTRIGLIVSIGYILLQALPHLMTAFSATHP
jgi:ElaB/YqjD/DUF883 family membrane-anchored ribosome-binding protein